MGYLQNGEWKDGRMPQETGKTGEFLRAESSFRHAITADGSSAYPAEAGRYHLYVMLGCPWAHRTLLYRAAKKLEDLITVDYTLPTIRTQGWTFGVDPTYPDSGEDSLHGYRNVHQVYTHCDKGYTGKVTVPVLWDKKTSTIVNNESSEIIRNLNTAFDTITGDNSDYYPPELRGEIDALNDKIYHNVNNGVYRCAFAKSQQAYEDAYDGVFKTLDELEDILSRQRYLTGPRITEADWRLFPTLVRFDVAYFSLFKCNRNRIADMTNLDNYMRDLYSQPGIAKTVNARQYIANYYSIADLNPTGLIPKGTPVDFTLPHDRERFGTG
ncbi:MAG: glutathione S-transferase family protein [Beijerinckiaceae bacterium]|jgi:glutathionyl-hydroquinone reductase|nr:glutathione S-transferase family protein [Beijerinckiaceae bacterium]